MALVWGDFLQGELTQYLTEDNCDKLRKFLALKNDPDKPQHFFRKWFRMQIYAAYNRVFEYVGKEIISSDPQLALQIEKKRKEHSEDDGGKANGKKKDKASDEKKPKEPKENSLKKYLTTDGRDEFATLVSLYWCKTPESRRTDGRKFAHELYTVVMFNLLGFSHTKIAALVGHNDHIASAGSERNFWRTVGEDKRTLLKAWDKATERIREVSAYSADAREEEDTIKALGETLTSLSFDGRHEDVERRWRMELHIPPKVGPGNLIRGIVQDYEGNVPEGKLFVCGKERKFRKEVDGDCPQERRQRPSGRRTRECVRNGGWADHAVLFVDRNSVVQLSQEAPGKIKLKRIHALHLFPRLCTKSYE